MEETMLSLRKGIRLVGSGTVAIAFGAGLLGAAHTASATPASATATPAPTTFCSLLSPAGQPPSDSIKLPNVGGIAFGSGGLDSSNNPKCGATLQWKIPPNTTNPSLTGTLYLKDALGKTAHVRITYYDVQGNVVTGDVSPDELATSNDQSFPVTLQKFSDPRFYRLSVSTEVKSGSSWVTESETNAYMGSSGHPGTSCTIDADKVEFGGSGGVSSGHPVNAALCSWTVNSKVVQATLNGTQYFEDGVGKTARVVLSTYDVHGTWLGDSYVATNSPTVNGVTQFPAIGSSVSNNRIYRAQVALQVQVGTAWQQVGIPFTWYI
jgi:hypothetical protein